MIETKPKPIPEIANRIDWERHTLRAIIYVALPLVAFASIVNASGFGAVCVAVLLAGLAASCDRQG